MLILTVFGWCGVGCSWLAAAAASSSQQQAAIGTAAAARKQPAEHGDYYPSPSRQQRHTAGINL